MSLCKNAAYDPMTLAYCVAGFTREVDRRSRDSENLYAPFEGEMGVFSQYEFLVVSVTLELAAEPFAGDWAGVFYYEVAEELGAWLAEELLDNGVPANDAAIEAKALELCRKCVGEYD